MGTKHNSKTQLKATYGEYDCPICGPIQVKGDSSKDIKYWHDLECHPKTVASTMLKSVAVVAKPKAVRKPKTMPAVATVADITARMQRLEELLTAKAEKSIAKAKDESVSYLDIKALEAEIVKLETKVMPMLMAVPEAYRDVKNIDLCNKELAAAKTDLAMAMLSPAYTRAEQAHDALVREERIKAATVQVAKDNAVARDALSDTASTWVEEQTERFNSMVNGDIWIPRPKRDPKRIPFMQDMWWALQTHAKYGVKDTDGNYVREPIQGKDRTWDNLSPIVAEVFDDLMAKYSFDFGTKHYDIRADVEAVDNDGFIIKSKSEVITKTYALPYDEWLGRITNIMHKVWHKTWNRRDVELANALAELGYYGTGKEDLGREYCTWARNVPAKVILGNMTSMQYAILKSQGQLPKDDPEAVQVKATSRRGR